MMEDDSRPWKRKRTEEEESCKSVVCNPDHLGPSSGSCGLSEMETRISPCNCDQSCCNCIRNDFGKSTSTSHDLGEMNSGEFCGPTFDKDNLNCNQNCAAIQPGCNCGREELSCSLDLTVPDCNQSNSGCSPSQSNIGCCSKRETCSSVSNKTQLFINPQQHVPKSASAYSRVQTSLMKNSFDNSKPSLVLSSSKFTSDRQKSSHTCSSHQHENNSVKCVESASTSLQGSSKIHLCECNSEVVKSSDKSMNSNSELKLTSDPFWNACSCTSSFDKTKNPDSPITANSPHEICNPGFEVLDFPVKSSYTQSDPESGEVDGESGETVIQSKQTPGSGVKGNNCDNERTTVTELIALRRVAKFRIQKSLGENLQDVRSSCNSLSGPSNDIINICDRINSDKITPPPNDDSKCGSNRIVESEHQGCPDSLRFKQRFSMGSSGDKGACPALTDVYHINSLPASILVNILRHLRICDLLHRASLVCKLWHQLVYDPDIWRRIDLRYQHKVTDKQLLTLTQISDRVTEIDISDTQNLTSDALECSLKWCGHLRSLYMSRSVGTL